MEENKELQKTIDTVVAEIAGLVIKDQDGLTIANEFLKKCKVTAKTVEDAYAGKLAEAQEKKKAAEAERKAVADEIKMFTDRLDKAEAAAKRIISAYLQEQERIRIEEDQKRRKEEEDRRIATAIETGHEEILDKPVTFVKAPEPQLSKGTYTVDVWEFEIVDKAKINPEFLVVDESAVRKTVQALKDRAVSVIGSGVKVTCRKDIRTRV